MRAGEQARPDGALPAPSGVPVLERRPPSLPRRRRGVQAALWSMVVIGLGLAFVVVLLNASGRVEAVAVTAQIPAGQQIPAEALAPVDVAEDTGLAYVRWGDRDHVGDLFAAVDIPAGALLVEPMLTAQPDALDGKVLVGLSLTPGQFPPRLAVGDTVNAIYVGQDAIENPILAAAARVHIVEDDDRPGSELGVALLVDLGESVALARAADAGDVALSIDPR